ncbi:hypothetical protein Tco_1514069, partial [Tanacetum coccineum]
MSKALTGEKSMMYSGRFCDWVKISSPITPEKNLTGENSHVYQSSNYPKQDPEE